MTCLTGNSIVLMYFFLSYWVKYTEIFCEEQPWWTVLAQLGARGTWSSSHHILEERGTKNHRSSTSSKSLIQKKNILTAKLALDFTTVTGNYFAAAEMQLVISFCKAQNIPHLLKNTQWDKAEHFLTLNMLFHVEQNNWIFYTGLWWSIDVRLEANTLKVRPAPITVTHFNAKQCALF